MKAIIIMLSGLAIFMLSFQKQDNVGKALFENNCKSCHLPNKATEIAPSFQNIRKDYGLKWTLDFLKDSRNLREQGDIKALYSYYIFGKIKHTNFPVLESKYIVNILDYVDSFPIDTLAFKHRKVSYAEKKKFVERQRAIDTANDMMTSISIDTLLRTTDDTIDSTTPNARDDYRRYNPKNQD